MTQQFPHHMPPEPPLYQPPAPPKKKRHWPLVVLAVAGGLFFFGGCGAVVASVGGDDSSTAVATSSPTDEPTIDETTDEPTEEPTVEASPDGTFTGSCAYELFPDKLTGEVDVENTGNVGIEVRVSISWPQLGYKPIKMHRVVKVPYGKSKTVRFHRSASTTEIMRLQDWQENHGFADGCKYHGRMVDTFGEAHA